MNQTEMTALIDQQWPLFLKDLDRMLKIASVQGPAEPGAPFGVEPKRALTAVTALGQAYGFKTEIVNDAMAYVQWGPDDQNYIGIVGHLDVVAAGKGWHFPPFSLSEQAERYYGRGILDNKGAIMACLFGMKLLKEAGITLKQTVRLIFGSNEESGSQDVALYLQQERPPLFGFTPDCKFPVVYGERGIVNYRITTKLTPATLARISDFVGDQAKDHVPDCLAVSVDDQYFEAKGRQTPTNAPQLGINAITVLAADLLAYQQGPSELLMYAQWLKTRLANQHYGEGLGLNYEDDASGRLIMTPYLWQKTATGFALELAIRYPITIQETQITQQLQQVLPERSTLEIIRSIPGVRKSPEAPFIKTLSRIYTEITGLDGTPVTTTGATYARVMPNIVAFGPSFPGQKGIAHKQDEWLNKADLKQMMAIYMAAIEAMAN
ncbi:Sapep family Mn(2+)-dependent dipeptidase [Agrilactobacillus yilanensis]|uniref:Sapep family Mn(2+)-dependent dipeptidase n=1 Tax=Agrilactobacillus yilanensis TaxID=2485997 RepID=A0ABW4J4X3_9LACO|nr:Sapep family Mn(2+)-dependent dipeptidase [Agrilactobacillus yilanensis]